MNQLYQKPDQPTDCLQALGTTAVDKCAKPWLSELRKLLLVAANADGEAASKPTGDVSLEASWTGLIDNTAADKIRELTGSGDIPAAAESTVIANGVPHQIPKERIINFDVAVLNDDLETFLRTLQYGWRGFLWPISRGSRIQGGNEGIEVVCTYSEPDNARGNEAIKMWKLKFVWYEQVSPPDNASPFKVFN